MKTCISRIGFFVLAFVIHQGAHGFSIIKGKMVDSHFVKNSSLKASSKGNSQGDGHDDYELDVLRSMLMEMSEDVSSKIRETLVECSALSCSEEQVANYRFILFYNVIAQKFSKMHLALKLMLYSAKAKDYPYALSMIYDDMALTLDIEARAENIDIRLACSISRKAKIFRAMARELHRLGSNPSKSSNIVFDINNILGEHWKELRNDMGNEARNGRYMNTSDLAVTDALMDISYIFEKWENMFTTQNAQVNIYP